jgi:hypothetical protein
MNRRDLVRAAAFFPAAAWLPRPGSPAEVRRQCFIADGISMNTGTQGACPKPVLDALEAHALRAQLAGQVGAPPETLAFARNTTEGMNAVAPGARPAAGRRDPPDYAGARGGGGVAGS